MMMVARRRVARCARVADVAAAVRGLSDPTTDGMTAAVVAHDLINCIDGTTAASVADNALAAAVISLCRGRSHESRDTEEGKDGEDVFHNSEEPQWVRSGLTGSL
jgi:hypothetical protein